jgi:hypothetical protein
MKLLSEILRFMFYNDYYFILKTEYKGGRVDVGVVVKDVRHLTSDFLRDFLKTKHQEICFDNNINPQESYTFLLGLIKLDYQKDTK